MNDDLVISFWDDHRVALGRRDWPETRRKCDICQLKPRAVYATPAARERDGTLLLNFTANCMQERNGNSISCQKLLISVQAPATS